MANQYPMTEDELLKLKAVVLYIIGQCKTIDYFHLFKILYFADRNHLGKYGRRIVKDTFCALQYGPVPSNLYDAIKIVTGKTSRPASDAITILSDALASKDTIYPNYLTNKEEADMDELSPSDIECIDQSIKENSQTPFDRLSDQSHDKAWIEAWEKKRNSPINELTLAEAGGADESMMEYVKENLELDSLIS